MRVFRAPDYCTTMSYKAVYNRDALVKNNAPEVIQNHVRTDDEYINIIQLKLAILRNKLLQK